MKNNIVKKILKIVKGTENPLGQAFGCRFEVIHKVNSQD